jgi:aerobic carbon-monoxide dehydrogenase medium subunit
MYPAPFRYHRAGSLQEAVSMLSQLGEEARILAGGQSLIPLMKLRLASPRHLVDVNFISGLSYIRSENGSLQIGPVTRHAEMESSAAVQQIPILRDCAAGIADVQVRNRGTLAGSLAEADPSGDWAPVLLTLETEVVCLGPKGERTLPLSDLISDAYTTVLEPAELIREVRVKVPLKHSGGAYVAFKRSAPVYATASAAVQLTLGGDEVCTQAAVALGCVGLTPIVVAEASKALTGQRLTDKTIDAAADAAHEAAGHQPD